MKDVAGKRTTERDTGRSAKWNNAGEEVLYKEICLAA